MKEEERTHPFDEWKSIRLQDIKKIYQKDFYEDILALTKYINKIGKTWTIDILEQNKSFLIAVVAEEVSWIYEIDREKDEFFRQMYLTRDHLYFLVRRMNEKRRIRLV